MIKLGWCGSLCGKDKIIFLNVAEWKNLLKLHSRGKAWSPDNKWFSHSFYVYVYASNVRTKPNCDSHSLFHINTPMCFEGGTSLHVFLHQPSYESGHLQEWCKVNLILLATYINL